MDFAEVSRALEERSAQVWSLLRSHARGIGSFADALKLVTARKRAKRADISPEPDLVPLKVGLVGGATLSPLSDLVEFYLWVEGFRAELFVGQFDNYVAEILEPASPLASFKPSVTVLLPSEKRCRFDGPLDAPLEEQRRQVDTAVEGLLQLCREAHERLGGDVVVTNFVLPAHHDIGHARTRGLTSDYSFRKAVNLELGLRAPASTLVCDLEFLGSRLGSLAARDPRHWLESKQMFAMDFAVQVARELAVTIALTRRSPRKVLVLDLDNTLWGGVIGDDGLDGLDLGDTSARGEAFKVFQAYVKSLKDRGVLLAVCSKNDYARAIEPFQSHPEMVLRLDDFVSFKANWEPKSENIREMSSELGLGVDSFVFVDDNPAETEVVRQFVPEVATITLGPDPAAYVGQLADSRHFEPRSVTSEDKVRSEQYRIEAKRQAFRATATDMASYLSSLEMKARVMPFRPEDVPRITQLINKSNQFNLTTRRRSEADVTALLRSGAHSCFTIRLADRFGDHGLIAVIITAHSGETLLVDTWLMSCRVLKRQVEELTMNEIVRLAQTRGATVVRGEYLPTPKNSMVRDLYPRFGFQPTPGDGESLTFQRTVRGYQPLETKILQTYDQTGVRNDER